MRINTLSNYRLTLAVLCATLTVAPVLAQGPGGLGEPPPGTKLKQPTAPKLLPDRPTMDGEKGTLYFQSNLGSFRVANAVGRIEFSFSGTVLIHSWDLDVKTKDIEKAPKSYKVTLKGNIRKELEKHGRTVYFGKGTIVVEGVWRALQWFGKDMKGQWYGHGSMSVVGEFDKQGNTGLYWYDPAKKNYWPTSLMELVLPERKADNQEEPVERKKG